MLRKKGGTAKIYTFRDSYMSHSNQHVVSNGLAQKQLMTCDAQLGRLRSEIVWASVEESDLDLTPQEGEPHITESSTAHSTPQWSSYKR